MNWNLIFKQCLINLQPAVHVQGQEPLTASMLASAPPQEQKQMLGMYMIPFSMPHSRRGQSKYSFISLEMWNKWL